MGEGIRGESQVSEEIEIVDCRALKIVKYFDRNIELQNRIEVISLVKSVNPLKKKKKKKSKNKEINFSHEKQIHTFLFFLFSIFQNCSVYQ